MHNPVIAIDGCNFPFYMHDGIGFAMEGAGVWYTSPVVMIEVHSKYYERGFLLDVVSLKLKGLDTTTLFI